MRVNQSCFNYTVNNHVFHSRCFFDAAFTVRINLCFVGNNKCLRVLFDGSDALNQDPSRTAMPNRPKYLNLFQIRMPLPALISIMHRVSGAVLFFALPLLLWWWQQSLSSATSFNALHSTFSNAGVKLVIIGLIWGYLHHVLAGIRHLFLDLDIGTDLGAARLSSILVLGISIVLTVIAGARLW